MASSQKYVKHLNLTQIKFNQPNSARVQNPFMWTLYTGFLLFVNLTQLILSYSKAQFVRLTLFANILSDIRISYHKLWHCNLQSSQQPHSIIKYIPILFLFLFILFAPKQTQAQFYDTIHRPNLEWFEIQSEHFRVIYHEGLEDLAQRTANILEQRYPEVQYLIGGQLKNYPVVINGYNDNGNGYVSTLHFRMEIEAPPISGKILNQVGSDRLDGLLSHELAHALQFSEFGSNGFTQFLSFFSPDIARSNHGLTPSGFREGLATHVESELNPQIGGRGNFSPFTNQFYQNIMGSSPWNLGQLLTPSTVYRPSDRYYIGGYHFTNWLIKTQKPDLIESSLKSFANFPLLGYAPHLWYHTGKSPRALYREFIRYETEKFDSILTAQKYNFQSSYLLNDDVIKNVKNPNFRYNEDVSITNSDTNQQAVVQHELIDKTESNVFKKSYIHQKINDKNVITKDQKLQSLQLTSTTPNQTTNPIQIFENDNQTGFNAYNPIWYNDHEIIYYSTSYNGRPGFYLLDLTNNSHELLFETGIEESFHFELSPDKKKLLYSRYHTHLIYDNHYTTDIYELDLESKKSNRISKKQRIRVPGYINDSTFVALQTEVDSHQPVVIRNSISISSELLHPAHQLPTSNSSPPLYEAEPSTLTISSRSTDLSKQINQPKKLTKLDQARPPRSKDFIKFTNPQQSITTPPSQNYIQVSINPVFKNILDNNDQPNEIITNLDNTNTPKILPVAAAIIIFNNQSGIYFSYDDSNPMPNVAQNPDIQLLNSSIYDLSWSSDGEKILFSADYQHTMQLFEYNIIQNSFKQLTHGPWNSMEASYSPDGTKIAFISLQSNQRKISIQDYKDFRPTTVNNPAKNINPDLINSRAQVNYLTTLNNPDKQKIPALIDTTAFINNSAIAIKPNNYKSKVIHQPQADKYTSVSKFSTTFTISKNSPNNTSTITPSPQLSLSTNTSKTNYTSVPYKTDPTWLLPRTIIPVSNKTSNKNARSIGLSFHSSDVLRKNVYALDLEYADKSIFYDLKYRYTGFFPAIQFNLNHTAYDPGNLNQRDGLEFFGEQREYGVSAPMRFNIDHRNSSNSIIFTPEFLNQSTRIRLKDGTNPINNQTTSWSGSNRIRLFSAFNYRLKQNIRSIDPNNGLILFYQSDFDINTINTDLKAFLGQRAGIYFYSSPLKKQNHTLRLGFQTILQNRFGYNTLNLIHEGFNYSEFSLAEKNFTSISTRYNIPLSYPDTGGILVPAYIENYYLTIFSESILNSQFQHLDSVVGIGIRGRFRFFYNIVFDIGIGVAVNPSLKGSETIVFNF